MATLEEVKAQAQALVDAVNTLDLTPAPVSPVEVTVEVTAGETPSATVVSVSNK